ncbi:transporter substrate-binding domain-containing protein [Uliginosibacterium gangwonense]|uniref:transporter substrate-binding domain-containing protein n=1 Tax=Uliginosibacterium gangwonense TaxID=392736 RepID=UPI0003709675|nr:transporter substrate-binding domain-containing protein [Uliginosibacterium gangwonense]
MAGRDLNIGIRKICLSLMLMALLLPGGAVAAPGRMLVIIDPPETALDKRNDFPDKLLYAILEKTRPKFGDYEIRFSRMAMDRKRLLYELERGERVNLSAKASQSEWESRLVPIRIPIDKGIGGYRLFHIRSQDQALFDQLKSIDELKHLRVGVQLGWSSLPIYQAYDFNMVTGNNYEGLFGMLGANRFDYMPRGLAEIFIEHDLRKTQYPKLTVEEHLLLYYPFPKYFFVSPTKPELAERVRTGLLALIADGTFDRMFYGYHAALLRRANLCQRRLFTVGNPELGKETPYNIETYWYDPQREPVKYGGCKK